MPQITEESQEPVVHSKEIQDALRGVMEKCEQEDTYIRKRHIFEAKQNDLYWHGFQYLYWDDSSQEFRIPTHETLAQAGVTREESEFIYDYVSNIFKAHGLSIIAAVGADVPAVVFSPINADNPADLRAAKKAEQLGKIIHKANNSKLHILHALFILYTQHIVAAYNYYKRDKKYGTVDVPTFKRVPQKVSADMTLCSECEFASELPQETCPECGSDQMLAMQGKTENVLSAVGSKEVNKGMSQFALYGVLNVRVPSYAADQDGSGYLIRYLDQHLSYVRNRWSHLRDKLSADKSDSFEKAARAPSVTSYSSETYTNNLVTEKDCWFRPWQFDILDDEVQAKLLKKTFPSGCYVIWVGDEFAEAKEEDLDEVWTITKGDLSRTIHGDPLGQIAIPQQDIENTVNNLLLACLEHSIPVTIADPEILDFELYGSTEVKPGLIYPGKKAPQFASFQDAFYTLKTATLPKEGTDMQALNDNKTQFLLGSFPSIFGGNQQQGSKTLGEYTQSRSYALQRLSIPYQLIYYWWGQMTHKAVKMYVKEMLEDDMYTLSGRTNQFETVSIFKEDFEGKFDLLIPESSGELPITFGQKRSFLLEAIGMNSEPVNAFLFSPESLPVVLRYLGFGELSSEQEVQAMKAFYDISLLLQGEPQEGQLDPSGATAPVLLPSVMPEPEVDDDEIQLRIMKLFLAGPGQDYKINKPGGYMNVLARARIHKQNIDMQLLQLQQEQQATMGGEK